LTGIDAESGLKQLKQWHLTSWLDIPPMPRPSKNQQKIT